jgi:hypothetical protein
MFSPHRTSPLSSEELSCSYKEYTVFAKITDGKSSFLRGKQVLKNPLIWPDHFVEVRVARLESDAEEAHVLPLLHAMIPSAVGVEIAVP